MEDDVLRAELEGWKSIAVYFLGEEVITLDLTPKQAHDRIVSRVLAGLTLPINHPVRPFTRISQSTPQTLADALYADTKCKVTLHGLPDRESTFIVREGLTQDEAMEYSALCNRVLSIR